MSRIDDRILNSAVYLYPNESDARQGNAVGGSGFLVSKESQDQSYSHVFAVTNAHVIDEGDSPVIRAADPNGETNIFVRSAGDWILDPDDEDLAVCPLGIYDLPGTFSAVPNELFITQATIDSHDVGPGDDVFMVGRLMSHDGKKENRPSLRFGNISSMAHPVCQEKRGHWQESFMVEMHSTAGLGGSAVYVRIPPLAPRPGSTQLSGTGYLWLLGINWGPWTTPPDENSSHRIRSVSNAKGVSPWGRRPKWITSYLCRTAERCTTKRTYKGFASRTTARRQQR